MLSWLCFSGCNVSSDGFHCSPVISIIGKCVFSHLVGTHDSKCITVPMVSKGIKVLSLLMQNACDKSKGSSFTSCPYERIWLGFINEFDKSVPNHNIWSPTRRYSVLSCWSVHTVQQRATGILLTGWYDSRKGFTLQISPVSSRRLQFDPIVD
jgi:hypothetical protein